MAERWHAALAGAVAASAEALSAVGTLPLFADHVAAALSEAVAQAAAGSTTQARYAALCGIP